MTTIENAELRAARSRIAELEAEVAIRRRAAQLLGEVVSPRGATRTLRIRHLAARPTHPA